MANSLKSSKEIIPGTKIGRLTVLHLVGDIRSHPLYEFTPPSYFRQGKVREVKCSCGTRKLISEAVLRSGNVQSCGCLKKEREENARRRKVTEPPLLLAEGTVCGRLTLGPLVRWVQDHPLFLTTPHSYLRQGRLREVTCSCGEMRLLSESVLVSKRVQSCGCLQREIRSNRANHKLLRTQIEYNKQITTGKIRLEQLRLKTLQLQQVPLRDEKAIEECGAEIRRLFALKSRLCRTNGNLVALSKPC